MSEGSAQAFITIFIAMMNGEEYKRAFNNETNRFLLTSIRKDYGENTFRKALIAVQKHIVLFYLRKGDLSRLQDIINEMKS